MKRTARLVSLLLSAFMLLSITAGMPANAFAVETVTQENYQEYIDRINFDKESFLRDVENAIKSRKSELNIASYKIPYSENNFNALYYFLDDNLKNYFYAWFSYRYYVGGNFYLVQIHYSLTEQKVNKIEDAANEMLEDIIDNDNLTDVEKALLVHDRLGVSTFYDTGYFNDNIDSESYSIYGALVKHWAVCQGFADTYTYLMNKVGIETYTISSSILNHAWNVVFIGGKPYYVDVTWDKPTYILDGYIGHRNFLRSADGIVETGHIGKNGEIDYKTSYNGKTINTTTYDKYYWQDSCAEFQVIDNTLYYINNTEGTLNRADNNHTVLYTIPDTWSTYNKVYYYKNIPQQVSEIKVKRQNTDLDFEIKLREQNQEQTSENSDETISESKKKLSSSKNSLASGIDHPYSWNNCSRLSKSGHLLLFNGADHVYKYDIDKDKTSVTFVPDKSLKEKIEDYYSIFGFKYEKNYLYCYIYYSTYCEEDKEDYLIKSYYTGDASVCAHSHYGSYISKSPTCQEAGTKVFICDACGRTYTETLPIIPHNYINGYCEYCELYDESYEIPTISVPSEHDVRVIDNSHPYYAYVVADKNCRVTLRSEGSPYKQIYLYDKNGNFKESNYGDEFSISFFAQKGDKYKIECHDYATYKGGEFTIFAEYDTSSGHQHIYEEQIVTPVTCTTDGATKYVCTVCGDTQTETIFALGHSFENNNCIRCDTKEYEYTVENGIATITKYNGYDSNITLPKAIEGVTVSEVGESAFRGTEITNLIIPEGYTSIESWSFFACLKLQSVFLPNSLKQIGFEAFGACYALTEVTIPANVESIGTYVFCRCNNLEKLTVDSNNKYYDSRSNCNAIIETKSNMLLSSCKTTVIPHSVEKIAAAAFYIKTPTSITIPKSVKVIYPYAFQGVDSTDVISDIYYTGTEDEWKAIEIGDNNKKISGATVHYNTAVTPCTTHVYDSVQINKEPTCSETGSKTFICSKCGNSYTEVLEKVPHSYSFGYCIYCGAADPDYTIPAITLPFYKYVDIVKGGTSYIASITAENNGVLSFYSSGDGDTYGYLYDENMNVLASNDDGGTDRNFFISYYLNKGKTYYISCKFYYDSTTGTIPLSVEFEIDTHVHSYVKTIMEDSTCTTKGRVRYQCHECGDVYYEELPLAQHNYKAYVTEPTCTEGGYTEHYCTYCYDSYTDSYTEALGHDYNEYFVAAPTCEVGGYTCYKCIRCNSRYNGEETQPLGHNYVVDYVFEPTCEEGGYTCYECSRCREWYNSDYTEPLGHDYVAEVVEPTCTENGYTCYECSRCWDWYDGDYTEPLGHDFKKESEVEPTCTEKGYSYYECTRCWEWYEGDYTPARGHKIVTEKAIPATFYSSGCTQGKYCSVCYETIKLSKTVAKLVSPSITKLKAGKKAFTASWKKAPTVDGYQIQYATNAKFSKAKTVTVKTDSTTKKTVKKLKAKKKYYVRVRAYKTINGKKQYSPWSAKKSVTTKK